MYSDEELRDLIRKLIQTNVKEKCNKNETFLKKTNSVTINVNETKVTKNQRLLQRKDTNHHIVIESLNANPDELDRLAEGFSVPKYIIEHDKKFRNAEKYRVLSLSSELRHNIETKNRDQLIDLIKIMDNHVKKRRTYLTLGVLESLNQMTEEEMKNWIFMKFAQHRDLTRLDILIDSNNEE